MACGLSSPASAQPSNLRTNRAHGPPRLCTPLRHPFGGGTLSRLRRGRHLAPGCATRHRRARGRRLPRHLRRRALRIADACRGCQLGWSPHHRCPCARTRRASDQALRPRARHRWQGRRRDRGRDDARCAHGPAGLLALREDAQAHCRDARGARRHGRRPAGHWLTFLHLHQLHAVRDRGVLLRAAPRACRGARSPESARRHQGRRSRTRCALEELRRRLPDALCPRPDHR